MFVYFVGRMVVCKVTFLSCTPSVFLLWNILIDRGVANLDLCIISWFGCSQHVSFALHFNICCYVWGHLIVVSNKIQFEMPGSWRCCEGCVLDLMYTLFVGLVWFNLIIIACHVLGYFGMS